MNINELINGDKDVILAISASDLKTVITQWGNELLESNKKKLEEDLYITAKEACEKLKVSQATIWRWGRDGRLNKKTVGSRSYYRLSDVNNLIVR